LIKYLLFAFSLNLNFMFDFGREVLNLFLGVGLDLRDLTLFILLQLF
jgi:hypothetical protein